MGSGNGASSSQESSTSTELLKSSKLPSKLERMRNKATKLFVSSLGDIPFRVIHSAVGTSEKMMRLLDERYAYNTIVYRFLCYPIFIGQNTHLDILKSIVTA